MSMPDMDTVRDALRRVVDPEAGINIVELGLVYAVEIEAARVAIDLTMTSPACPMGEMISDEAREVVQALLPPGAVVDLRLVWEPPWSPALMSESARGHFGWDE